MKLNEIKSIIPNLELYRDGDFDDFAQCIVKLNKKIMVFYDDEKYLNDLINNKNVSCVICSSENVNKIPNDKGILISSEPRYAFFKLFSLVMKERKKISKTIVGKNVKIGINTFISDYNVIIGNNVTIGNNCVIKDNTIIEDNVEIGSNCVVGEDGFEVKRRMDGSLFPVDHYGKVIIKKDAVLKSMVSIHKSVFDWDTTEIGNNCVIDSFCHIAHGNKIGKSVLIGANSTISGNCIIEDFACIDPNACIAKRITIGKQSKVSIGSVVTKNVPDGMIVTGNFAIQHKKWIDFVKSIAN